MSRAKNSVEDIILVETTLHKLKAFELWPRAAMARLLSASYVGHHAPAEVVSNELSGVSETFIIVSGQVIGARASEKDGLFPVILLGPGVLMGITQPFGKRERTAYTFTAQTQVVAIHIPNSLLIELLDANPARWKEMLVMMVGQHAAHAQTLKRQAAGLLQQRLAATLDRLAHLYGTKGEADSAIRLQVSQAELAAILQVTRQALSRELTKLVKTGAISLGYKTLTVLKSQALQDIAKLAP